MVVTTDISSSTIIEGEGQYEPASSVRSDYNTADSLLHLVSSELHVDDKVEATVHPMANLDMLTGAHRGPALPLFVLKDNAGVCITCGVDFKSRASLHAHLVRHRHLVGTLEQFTGLPKYECRSCEGQINCTSMLKHKCFSKQQADIRQRIKILDRDGSPLVCILCRGRLLPSRVHLIIHIIVAHSIHRDPYRCVFCQAQFHSENLMMQEVHAFDCHAPELFMLTRKACFQLIRSPQGTVTDPTVPFTCFYDATKLEGADISNLFRPKTFHAPQTHSASASAERVAPVVVSKRRMCTATFTSLDEYTTHLCCVHGAVAPQRSSAMTEEDPIEEVRRAKSQTNRVPGPKVREMLKSQAAGHHAPTKGSEDEFSPSSHHKTQDQRSRSTYRSGNKKRGDKGAPTLKARQRPIISTFRKPSMHNTKQREMCRICLDYFSDEEKLEEHVGAFHVAESRKRLKHLADKDMLSGLLDIDVLCTECYMMFPDSLSLQIHMMVSHASKDWRHCGLCSYEFYSENGGTPNHLRLVKFSSNQETSRDAASGNPPPTEGGSSMDAWPLPAELMWRIIMTHEARHRERLFPPRPVPYLPVGLIDLLIDGKAIQAVMASQWMIRKAKEEIEGIYATDEELTNMPDIMTTEDAFDVGPGKKPILRVDEVALEEARKALISVLRQTDEMLEEDVTDRDPIATGRVTSLRLSTVVTTPGSRLPAWLVRKFTELGEVNEARQVELDFAENL